MKVTLIDTKSKKERVANISKIEKKELPLKKDGWNFNWRELYKIEGAEIYKISLLSSPKTVEGLVMLTIYYDEMVFMNNIEIAPWNIGKKKILENVAGCLLAFACRDSFERGLNTYKGFLSFDSKTRLIELYQDKYGAQWAMGNKMYFDPIAGKKLIKKYLGLRKF